jgi:hypothetical protein
MNKFEKALEMSDEDFVRRFGYSKTTMKRMVEILHEAYEAILGKTTGKYSTLIQ